MNIKIAPSRKPQVPSITWTGPTTHPDQIAGLSPHLTDKHIVRFVIPTTEDVQAMNYHPKLFQDSTGRVHLASTCHDRNESGPGSWIRYHTSDDRGTTWVERDDICPALCTYALGHTVLDPRIPLPSLWVEIRGRVFLLVDTYIPPRDETEGTQLLACEVVGNTVLTPTVVRQPLASFAGFPTYEQCDLADEMLREIRAPWGTPWPAGTADIFPYRPTINVADEKGSGLNKIAVEDGYLLFARGGTSPGDDSSHFAWVAFSYDGVAFSDFVESPFPNGRSKIVIKKISDRYLALTHNSNNRSSLISAESQNGYDWTATKMIHSGFHFYEHKAAYDADGGGDWQNFYKQYYDGVGTFSTSPNWAGTAKGGGPSYQDFLQLDNGQILCAFGERGKEVIGTVRWTL